MTKQKEDDNFITALMRQALNFSYIGKSLPNLKIFFNKYLCKLSTHIKSTYIEGFTGIKKPH